MGKTGFFIRNLWIKLKGYHTRNREKGLYGYMWWSALKIIFFYIIILAPVILIARHLIDLNVVFQYIFNNHSTGFILSVFFVSESFLGMIPPDLFVIWSSKFDAPFFLLTILGILSYIGGLISYLIGSWLSERPKIKSYSERVLEKYIVMVRKWGGAFIIIAALFPFSPFSMIIMAVSLLKYPLKFYLLFGITRIARFIIQGVFYLGILNVDELFALVN